ncbi:MAG: ribosome-associated translation inhibitor RaiA [Erysipelotrichaceae bacterium]|nr:ribosome-associated translation inhibitor RaiA [Erysipelotrichaceae bacterium]
MKVNVHGKDLTVSADMVERIEHKLSFLDKYILIDDDTTAQAIVKKNGNDIKLEITVPTKVGYLRSEVVNKEIQDAVDISIDKLEDQIRRQKTRLSRRHKEKLAKNFVAAAAEDPAKEPEKPIRVKRLALDEMDVDEAILQMDLADHDFYIFRDVDSGVVSVLYRRKSGGYGVIEAV